MWYAVHMEGKEMNGFESVMRSVAAGANMGGIGFKRVSDCITKVDFAYVGLTANVVMPYSGMGVFYFGVPYSSEMSVDKLPKSMDAVKKLKFFKLNYCIIGGVWVNKLNFDTQAAKYNSYIESVVSVKSVIICIAITLGSYILSMLLLGRKVRNVEMTESLKDNRE